MEQKSLKFTATAFAAALNKSYEEGITKRGKKLSINSHFANNNSRLFLQTPVGNRDWYTDCQQRITGFNNNDSMSIHIHKKDSPYDLEWALQYIQDMEDRMQQYTSFPSPDVTIDKNKLVAHFAPKSKYTSGKAYLAHFSMYRDLTLQQSGHSYLFYAALRNMHMGKNSAIPVSAMACPNHINGYYTLIPTDTPNAIKRAVKPGDINHNRINDTFLKKPSNNTIARYKRLYLASYAAIMFGNKDRMETYKEILCDISNHKMNKLMKSTELSFYDKCAVITVNSAFYTPITNALGTTRTGAISKLIKDYHIYDIIGRLAGIINLTNSVITNVGSQDPKAPKIIGNSELASYLRGEDTPGEKFEKLVQLVNDEQEDPLNGITEKLRKAPSINYSNLNFNYKHMAFYSPITYRKCISPNTYYGKGEFTPKKSSKKDTQKSISVITKNEIKNAAADLNATTEA